MTDSVLHQLAKAPIILQAVITRADQTIPSETETNRFRELVRESAGPNARKSSLVAIMQYLEQQGAAMAQEVERESHAETQLQDLRSTMEQNLPPQDLTRFRILLGRFAFAVVRNEFGNPVPARLAVAEQWAGYLGYPAYGKFSKRKTDGVEAGAWWPGTDPTLQGLDEISINRLVRVFSALVSTLLGAHGSEPSPALEQALKQALHHGYSNELAGTATGALLRYHDQLFNLLGAEIQGAESALPLFQQGREVLVSRLSEQEQQLYLQALHQLGLPLAGPTCPVGAQQIFAQILGVMNGNQAEEEPLGPLTAAELDVLCVGLTAVFIQMASVHGKIGTKQCGFFFNILQKITDRGDHASFTVQAMVQISNHLVRYLDVITKQRRSPLELKYTGMLLANQRLSETDAQLYRTAIMKIAKDMALAEGKGMFGFGSKIAPQAAQLLDFLSGATGISWK